MKERSSCVESGSSSRSSWKETAARKTRFAVLQGSSLNYFEFVVDLDLYPETPTGPTPRRTSLRVLDLRLNSCLRTLQEAVKGNLRVSSVALPGRTLRKEDSFCCFAVLQGCH